MPAKSPSHSGSMSDKVSKVMREFEQGTLRSSSGQKVTNQKQALAIALSEAQRAKKK